MADKAGAPGAVWAFTEHEHRELSRGINHIHDVACGIGDWVTSTVPDDGFGLQVSGDLSTWNDAGLHNKDNIRT